MYSLRLNFEQLKTKVILKLLASTNYINVIYESEVPCKRTERDMKYGYFQSAV